MNWTKQVQNALNIVVNQIKTIWIEWNPLGHILIDLVVKQQRIDKLVQCGNTAFVFQMAYMDLFLEASHTPQGLP